MRRKYLFSGQVLFLFAVFGTLYYRAGSFASSPELAHVPDGLRITVEPPAGKTG